MVRPSWFQFQQPPIATPDQTPDTELEAQDLTDESLEVVRGGAKYPVDALSEAKLDGARALAAEPEKGAWNW